MYNMYVVAQVDQAVYLLGTHQHRCWDNDIRMGTHYLNKKAAESVAKSVKEETRILTIECSVKKEYVP